MCSFEQFYEVLLEFRGAGGEQAGYEEIDSVAFEVGEHPAGFGDQ